MYFKYKVKALVDIADYLSSHDKKKRKYGKLRYNTVTGNIFDEVGDDLEGHDFEWGIALWEYIDLVKKYNFKDAKKIATDLLDDVNYSIMSYYKYRKLNSL